MLSFVDFLITDDLNEGVTDSAQKAAAQHAKDPFGFKKTARKIKNVNKPFRIKRPESLASKLARMRKPRETLADKVNKIMKNPLKHMMQNAKKNAKSSNKPSNSPHKDL